MELENSVKDDSTPVAQLRAHFIELLKCLERERAALVAHDGAELDDCVAQKQALCEAIATTLSNAPELAAALQQAAALRVSTDPQSAAELDEDHKTLLDLAISARDYNLVNGKILHRSQQSVREILGILSGKSLDGLYGQTGQQNAASTSSGQAIARA